MIGGNMNENGGKSSRRAFLKAGAVGALAMGAASTQNDAGAAAQPPRPNFIFITTDGHRPDALSLNGNSILGTPNIDRIGREGIQFQNSFMVNALCLPSRASALTGLYSHTTGCIDNHDSRAIPADIPMFTDLLREAGYEVKCAVIPSEARNLTLVFLGRAAQRRAGFLAEFTLSTQSEILRFAQDDSEGLGMTLHGFWVPVSR
jgi:hypothetical protein